MRTWAIGVLLILLAALFMLNPDDGKLTKDEAGTQITYSLAENTLIGRNKGEKTWEIRVKRFSVDQDERFVYLSDQINGIIYRDGVERYWLTATEGIYNQRTQDLTISSSLEITTEDDERVTAAGLWYEYSTDRVVLKPPIRASVGKYTLTADEVILETEPERLIASGNVVITSKDNEEIRCTELYYYSDTNTWQVVGTVEISSWLDAVKGDE